MSRHDGSRFDPQSPAFGQRSMVSPATHGKRFWKKLMPMTPRLRPAFVGSSPAYLGTVGCPPLVNDGSHVAEARPSAPAAFTHSSLCMAFEVISLELPFRIKF